LQITKQGGLVGLLTPTSFLSGQSFSKLRTKLLTHGDTLHVDVLNDRNAMFIDVEQETAITVLRTSSCSKLVDSRTRVSVLKPDGEFEDVGESCCQTLGALAIPRAPDDAGLLQLAESAGFTLSDYGYVARVGHLVAYRDERQRFARGPPPNPADWSSPWFGRPTSLRTVALTTDVSAALAATGVSSRSVP